MSNIIFPACIILWLFKFYIWTTPTGKLQEFGISNIVLYEILGSLLFGLVLLTVAQVKKENFTNAWFYRVSLALSLGLVVYPILIVLYMIYKALTIS